jgi:hypothetical protein
VGIFGKLMNYSVFVTKPYVAQLFATQAKQDITPMVADRIAERRWP